MATDLVSKESVRARVDALRAEAKVLIERRKMYGESGFRCSQLVDDLLREAEGKERLANEFEKLLQ